ncbi:hypothetical protein SISNIDRAFT_490814 [Sistotremastrum niveocremeum HHB9708]|uniref:Glycosyltransferase family 1 protein n=1 Tax=Sistotremastrum niveocremeum HHB9708 TaxID=1314777 RepID=A0A164NH90_9AGAM|nr:hypothetical protein SISNIDRAFT_490814 [Sistotremastrum niveocremeum HHB9708]
MSHYAHSRRLFVPFIAVSLISIFLLLLNGLHSEFNIPLPDLHQYSLTSSSLSASHVVHNRIYFSSSFGAHYDVYLALAGSVQRILKTTYPNDYVLKVYVSLPMRYEFQEIVDRGTGLYQGNMTSNGLFLDDFRRAYETGEDPTLLVLGTCEVDMPDWGNTLLELWDSLPDHRKFYVVCGIHNIGQTWTDEHLADWSKRGAIRTYGISEHVAKGYRGKLLTMADSPEEKYYTADLEHVRTDYFVPILNLKNMPWRSSVGQAKKASKKPLTDVVIQGNFEQERRDYAEFFKEFEASIHQDPEAWGYTKTLPWEPVPSLNPFTIHLMGNGKEDELDIPNNVRPLIKIWKDVDYPKYYEMIAKMDILVPNFNAHGGYYVGQASSSVVMAVECNTPILANHRLRAAYTYLSDALTIERPSALREIDALKVLRTGTLPASNWTSLDAPPKANMGPINNILDDGLILDNGLSNRVRWTANIPPRERAPELWDDMEIMLKSGWRRSDKDMERAKQSIWTKNDEFSKRLLQGI